MADPSQFKPAHISASAVCGDLCALDQEALNLEDAGVDSIHVVLA